MPCVVAHTMMSHVHHTVCTCSQAGCPYDFMACQILIICLPFAQAEGLLLQLTTSYFNALNVQMANQNVLERIFIAMQDENRLIAMRTSGYAQRNL